MQWRSEYNEEDEARLGGKCTISAEIITVFDALQAYCFGINIKL